MKPLFVFMSFLLLGTTAEAASLREPPSFSTRLDSVIDDATRSGRVVGAVVLVSVDGAVVYRRASGWADREKRIPMREDTVFRYSSLTKPLVAASALLLVERGVLLLDDPVSRWLPSFRPRLPEGRVPAITVRQLLTHTAGLSYGFFEKADGPYHALGVSDGLDASSVSLDENVARLGQAPLLFEPGTAWRYSLSMDVLGAVLEKAAKEPLPLLVERLVAKPLGLKSISFVAAEEKRLAVPYASSAPLPVRMTDPFRISFGESEIVYAPSRALSPQAYPSGGAGALGNADDYLRFLEALRTGSVPGLGRASVDGFFSNQVGDLPVAAGPGWGWTLGAAVLKDPALAKSPMNAGTCQWGGVYGHTWWIDPKARLCVVVLTNTALEGMAGSGRFPEDVRTALYDSAAAGL